MSFFFLIFKSLMNWKCCKYLTYIYIVDIQTYRNHSKSKLVQSRMWTPSRHSILRKGPQWSLIMPRRVSWKPYSYYFHIWISHIKNSRMPLIYHNFFTAFKMFTRIIANLQKNSMEKLSRFFSPKFVVPKILTEFVFWIC